MVFLLWETENCTKALSKKIDSADLRAIAFILENGLELGQLPPHSPDLAPSDSLHHFNSDGDIIAALYNFLEVNKPTSTHFFVIWKICVWAHKRRLRLSFWDRHVFGWFHVILFCIFYCIQMWLFINCLFGYFVCSFKSDFKRERCQVSFVYVTSPNFSTRNFELGNVTDSLQRKPNLAKCVLLLL